MEEKAPRGTFFTPRNIIFFIIAVTLVVFLVSRIDVKKTISAFSSARPGLILLACCIYFASNFFKALRFMAIMKNTRVGIFNMFTIVSFHNFFNQVMPARTGELTLIYYLKKIGGVKATRGLHSLIVVRIFDMIIVSLFFVVSFILYFGTRESSLLLYVGIAMAVISIIALFNIKWMVIVVSKVFYGIGSLPFLQDKKLVKKLLEKVYQVEEEFSQFDTRGNLPMIAVTSLMVWTALYTLSFVVIRGFNIDIGYIPALIGATGGILTNVLPINSFGSFGTLEAGWTGGFLLVGMSMQDAVTTGFGNHLVMFFAGGFIALFCALVQKLKKDRSLFK